MSQNRDKKEKKIETNFFSISLFRCKWSTSTSEKTEKDGISFFFPIELFIFN